MKVYCWRVFGEELRGLKCEAVASCYLNVVACNESHVVTRKQVVSSSPVRQRSTRFEVDPVEELERDVGRMSFIGFVQEERVKERGVADVKPARERKANRNGWQRETDVRW